MVQFRHVAACTLLALTAGACEQLKSSNPLSPQVAGPMDGITMTAPKDLEPGNGWTVPDKVQPIAFLVENSATNTPRAVQLRIQIAGDNGFTNIVYSRDGIAIGSAGRTSYTMPSKLESGRSYYWRAQAYDGANVSPWSSAVKFDLLAPVVLGTPDPKSPVGNTLLSNTTPTLVVNNGTSTGPYGELKIHFEVADNPQFSPIFSNNQVPIGSGTTSWEVPPLPAYDKTFYWRARTFDPFNVGTFSRVETFRSPSPPPPPPPAPKPPSGGGGSSSVGNNWQACSQMLPDHAALSQCVHDAINPGSSASMAFEVTKRIAWLLRGEGAGLLIKNGGENIIPWRGYSFSLSRICYPNGQIWKVLSDAGEGGTNGWSWSDNGFVDTSLYVPAIDPSLPEPDALSPAPLLDQLLSQLFRPEALSSVPRSLRPALRPAY